MHKQKKNVWLYVASKAQISWCIRAYCYDLSRMMMTPVKVYLTKLMHRLINFTRWKPTKNWAQGLELFSISTPLSKIFILHINFKIPRMSFFFLRIVGINYLLAVQISCSADFIMKKVLWPRGLACYKMAHIHIPKWHICHVKTWINPHFCIIWLIFLNAS